MKNQNLQLLSKEMENKGFDVKMAYVNRLRILDCKLENFDRQSKPVHASLDIITRKIYEDMYERPVVEKNQSSFDKIEHKIQKFKEIYSTLNEFCDLSHAERKLFIHSKKPVFKRFDRFQIISEDMRGRS